MAGASRKTLLKTINGTPEKRVFLSIINDYDLKTGLCELIDNALDLWLEADRKANLKVTVTLDADRQYIQVRDNAGGVPEEKARLLIAPGASRGETDKELIGTFGVGGKRASVALGEHVEIRTRFKNQKSIQLDITNEWLLDPDDWDLDVFEIPDVPSGTTAVDISKVRQSFDLAEVERIRQHLGETYSWFIKEGCEIELNSDPIVPIVFNKWSYPPSYLPRKAIFVIKPTAEGELRVTLTAGLISDRNRDTENYGVYFYCNQRLIVKELRTRDVGYVSGEAGVPHPDASLCRVIVKLQGPAELMPWNSSKNDLNYSHPAFTQIRLRIIDFAGYFSSVSRRLKHDWDTSVFHYNSGQVEVVSPTVALSDKKKVLPRLPSKKRLSLLEDLKTRNKKLLADKPWTLGLVEAMGVVDLIARQKSIATRNRVALILLDSNFEIALKEFIVSRKDLFPAYKWDNVALATLFKKRTEVIKEVQPHAKFSSALLGKVSHYYNLRNSLIHERASTMITDEQVHDYRQTIEVVLKKLFKVRFPDNL